MKIVIFGLSVSSSWGNGHATLWRGLIAALAKQGHAVVFFERDVPYYAANRDVKGMNDVCAAASASGSELVLYPSWEEALPAAKKHLASADVAMVTSYCPDAIPASDLSLASRGPLRVFYDLDTPVTLGRLRAGEAVPYIPPYGLSPFDLVLSFTGGVALTELTRRLGARRVAPLYGSVDPKIHRPVPRSPDFAADLSYLGTYSADRKSAFERLFLSPARALSSCRFLVAGSLYPEGTKLPANVRRIDHVPPASHPAFYCSSPLTLNLTRAPMAEMGYCPSGRLFEAAACGVPIISDTWEGLSDFFQPGREILVARRAEDIVFALSMPRKDLAAIGRAARERTLAEHTAERRARRLIDLLTSAAAIDKSAAPSPDPARDAAHDPARIARSSELVGGG
jgi:spore maturation protein CgeB